ncbi:MAG TPA: uracil-DNA glycosylase family protein [Cytophagaceae bacterium]|jgi:hypothetical protein
MSLKTFADKIIAYNKSLDYQGKLPHGVRVMNPFREYNNVIAISSEFYKKYYTDQDQRRLILGINPGRFGAGLTGIPFTDPKRLASVCGIEYLGPKTHEPSSVFIYEMIRQFGGPEEFYRKFYIHSIFPLGFTSIGKKGKEVNFNYYDNKELISCVYDFIVDNIRKQIDLGINTDLCFCFGTGKNEKFLTVLNNKYRFFKKIIALEHPRFVIQYKSKNMQYYIDKYISAFSQLDRY